MTPIRNVSQLPGKRDQWTGQTFGEDRSIVYLMKNRRLKEEFTASDVKLPANTNEMTEENFELICRLNKEQFLSKLGKYDELPDKVSDWTYADVWKCLSANFGMKQCADEFARMVGFSIGKLENLKF